jgi:hypothetical protein
MFPYARVGLGFVAMATETELAKASSHASGDSNGAPPKDGPEHLGPLYQPDRTLKTGNLFISPDSLTFPTAAAVSAALVNSVGVFSAAASRNVWIVLAASFIVGSIIVAVGWPEKSGKRSNVIYGITGLLNILLLFAGVMGLTSMATQTVPGLPG